MMGPKKGNKSGRMDSVLQTHEEAQQVKGTAGWDRVHDRVKERLANEVAASKRGDRLAGLRATGLAAGREEGRLRQRELSGLSIPHAALARAGYYVGDKVNDLDAWGSGKVGLHDRAARTGGSNEGLDQEGFKKGGSVRGNGCATKGVKKCKMR